MDGTCETCKFSGNELEGLACKRYPPQTTSAYLGGGEWKSFTEFTIVDPDDGCGEYKEKETT